MKLLAATVSNFGSYKKLDYKFHNQGLALIYGSTGSGKSTLQDIPIWVLFGITAKDGAADDVKSWTNEGEPTTGTLTVQVRDEIISITRIRGQSGQNDLYWDVLGQNKLIRFKDMIETQKQLNLKLGVDSYLFSLASYYNEFAASNTFFTAKASDRREFFEALADLQLPTLLTERIKDEKKESKKNHTEQLEKFNRQEGRLEYLRKSQTSIKADAIRWRQTQDTAIKEAQVKANSFDKDKELRIITITHKLNKFEENHLEKIKKLKEHQAIELINCKTNKTCINCGHIRTIDAAHLEAKTLQHISSIDNEYAVENPHISELQEIQNSQNPYLYNVQSETTKQNPFTSQIERTDKDLKDTMSLHHSVKVDLESINHRIISLIQLNDLTEQLRSYLLQQTIKTINNQTNTLLEKYFESEIRIDFTLRSNDKLETTMWKSGHECSYKQLSKGQKGLLKLCFAVATMKTASNKIGMHFNTLMFDESLDGLDNTLKLKAYHLFDELSLHHDSVLVIDHNEELQNLFNKKFHVTIDSDTSSIEEC